jgi:hypothetical protein
MTNTTGCGVDASFIPPPPEVIIRTIELAFDLIVDIAPDANAPSLDKLLRSCSDVHPVAADRVTFGDEVAQVYADAERHAPVFGQRGILLGQPLRRCSSCKNRPPVTGAY